MSPLAALACDPAKAWPSFLKFIMPFLNINFLRPTRFSAVYFPAWFVNGEVEARITYENFQEVRSIYSFVYSRFICFLQVKLSALFEDTCVIHICVSSFSSSPGNSP